MFELASPAWPVGLSAHLPRRPSSVHGV